MPMYNLLNDFLNHWIWTRPADRRWESYAVLFRTRESLTNTEPNAMKLQVSPRSQRCVVKKLYRSAAEQQQCSATIGPQPAIHVKLSEKLSPGLSVSKRSAMPIEHKASVQKCECSSQKHQPMLQSQPDSLRKSVEPA